MSSPTYPFDTTGTAPSNLIQGELHTLTEVNSAPYRILIPTFAPFYVNNLLLEHVSITGEATPLAEGVDFYCVLPYMAAQRSLGRPVYGGVMMMTSLAQGTIRQRYQTVGGDWCADANYVYERLLETIFNQRMTWWDTITNVQEIFPPTDHSQGIVDVTGIDILVEQLSAIRQAIMQQRPSDPSFAAHILQTGNVHGLTKTDIGLDMVSNLPLATDQEVQSRSPVDKYITLRQLLMLVR